MQKSFVKLHSDKQKNKEDIKAITFRDKKQSITDFIKQGTVADLKSYSKEGKRLDY